MHHLRGKAAWGTGEGEAGSRWEAGAKGEAGLRCSGSSVSSMSTDTKSTVSGPEETRFPMLFPEGPASIRLRQHGALEIQVERAWAGLGWG